jgi:hypothetical protein
MYYSTICFAIVTGLQAMPVVCYSMLLIAEFQGHHSWRHIQDWTEMMPFMTYMLSRHESPAENVMHAV